MLHNYLHTYKITLDKTYKNHTCSMTFFKNIHRSRRTGPNLMKSNCAFQNRKICGFPDKCPIESINFVNLNFTIKICLPLDIITQFLCSSWFTNSPWTQILYRYENIALHTWWIISILLKNKFFNDFTSF